MRVALYLRISTADQTTDNQRLELETVARNRGWTIVEVYEDAAISGSKGRDKRPAFDNLLKDATRGKFDMIASWSVDRLGRSLQDLVGFINDLDKIGCQLYLHQQAIDTSTPSGRAMFQMCGVFAEFERAMIIERVMAGLSRARLAGKTFGRPKIEPEIEDKIVELRNTGMGKIKIGKTLGVGTGTVQRVLSERSSEAI